MSITYDQLVTQSQSYAQKNDAPFISMIPYFINMGMERIYREAEDMGIEKTVTGIFAAGSNLVQKPPNWNQTVSFGYGTPKSPLTNMTILFERPYEFCTAWMSSGAVVQGPPLFYANNPSEINPYSRFFIVPAPDQGYQYQLIYLTLPPYVPPGQNDSAFNNNWVFQRAPSLIFYASYLEALAFMANPEQLAVFEKLYARALNDLNRQSRQRLVDRTADVEKE